VRRYQEYFRLVHRHSKYRQDPKDLWPDPRTYALSELSDKKCHFHVHPDKSSYEGGARNRVSRGCHKCNLEFPVPYRNKGTEWLVDDNKIIRFMHQFGRHYQLDIQRLYKMT
jgi:hypothetical protein